MEPELRDTLKETNSVVFSLTLNRAGEAPVARTLTIEYIYFEGGPTVKTDVGSFRSLLLGKFNKFIQPNGWRDANITEDEWTITAVEAKVINKNETKLDYNS